MTGYFDLVFFEKFGRTFKDQLVWSGGFIVLGIFSIAILAGMHRELLWKWTCQKSWKRFALLFLLVPVFLGSIGFYIGLKGLWKFTL